MTLQESSVGPRRREPTPRRDLVAHTGASSNPCRAREGALEGAALRGSRPQDAAGNLQSREIVVAHPGARSNPCRARKGALKRVALRGLRPKTQRSLARPGELVLPAGPSWNQIERFLRDLAALQRVA